MADISSYWPAWAAIGVATLVFVNQAITESEKFANLLGRFGRSIYARSKRRYQMDQIEFSSAVQMAVASERQKWSEDEARALTVVTGQMTMIADIAKQQKIQLEELNFQLRCMTAYVEYEAEWHHRFRMVLLSADVGNGLINTHELPDHMHYADFEKKCKDLKNMSWRTWT